MADDTSDSADADAAGDDKPVKPANATLTRLITPGMVKYTLLTLVTVSFMLTFLATNLFVSGLGCTLETTNEALTMASSLGSGQSFTAAHFKAFFIQCMYGMVINPLLLLLSFLAGLFVSLPVYSAVQSVERGELLRTWL